MQKIRLTQPADKSVLTSKKPRLKWTPVRGQKLRYSLTVFATRPLPGSGPGRSRRSKPLPLFTTKALKAGFYDVPIRGKGLKQGRTYWWQIRGQDQNGQVRAVSEKRRFMVKTLPEDARGPVMDNYTPERPPYVTDASVGAVGTVWLTHPEKFRTPPPVVWGKPVKLRLRGAPDSETTEPESPPGGGAVEPIVMVWSNAAGEIYLPPYLMGHADLYWDLSGTGCDQVLLQIAGPDGFVYEPGDPNVLNDPGMVFYYWGPPTIHCGDNELFAPSGFLGGDELSAHDLDLLATLDGSGIPERPRPNQDQMDIVRHIRTVPCDHNRQVIGSASDHVTVHCVGLPALNIPGQGTDWTWGSNPSRTIQIRLGFLEPFPNVPESASAPSTLLVFTHPSPMMASTTSMVNRSLTVINPNASMNEEPVERTNQILLVEGSQVCDSYVIPLPEWPSLPLLIFRLEQEWHGGINPLALQEFLEPTLGVAVIPGIDPSWRYCQGASGDTSGGYDSLYGSEETRDQPTFSPFLKYVDNIGNCLPETLVATGYYGTGGYTDFNEFMESTFRGTREVVHYIDGSGPREFTRDEPAGTREVSVRFETDNTALTRFVVPLETMPVMMRETRDTGEVLWRVKCLDGLYAGLWTSGSGFPSYYGSRAGASAGMSRFDPPRMQMWLSVLIGYTDEGTTRGDIWADIHYDLTAE